MLFDGPGYDGRVINRIPDELFRRRPEQQGAAGPSKKETPGAEPEGGSDRDGAPRPSQRPRQILVPIRIAAVLVFVALVTGFLVARFLLDQPNAVVSADPTEQQPSSVTPSSQESGLSFYDGPTTTVTPLDAGSTCEGNPRLLLDGFPTTAWHCEGDGVGEKLTFTFDQGQPIVGVRIIGGNTAQPGRFDVERRILSVRWRFSDGSWFEQGLPSHESGAQEVEFPPIVADYVELEILTSTDPGEPDEWNADTVSISEVEFMAPE